jgi:hypothetical protein
MNEKEKDKDTVSEMVKTRRLDQRLLQCTPDGQWFCYISKEFIEALGLTKGSNLILIVKDGKIELYPAESFLTKAGMGLGESA